MDSELKMYKDLRSLVDAEKTMSQLVEISLRKNTTPTVVSTMEAIKKCCEIFKPDQKYY